jgi:hypothetical protein
MSADQTMPAADSVLIDPETSKQLDVYKFDQHNANLYGGRIKS